MYSNAPYLALATQRLPVQYIDSGLAANALVVGVNALTGNDDYVLFAAHHPADDASPGATGLSGFDPADSRLRWAPPPLVSPTTLTVPTGTTFYAPAALGDSEDAIVVLPATTRLRGIEITGGRNIHVIGGRIVPNAGTTMTPLRFKYQTGEIYIEGVEIDLVNDIRKDAINWEGRPLADPSGPTYPNLTVQNCRLINIKGVNANLSEHGDAIQPQGPVGKLRADKNTITTGYQGIFVPPQAAITSTDLSRIDFSYITGVDPTTYAVWFLDSAAQAPSPVSLQEIYITPRSGQSIGPDAVWPKSTLGGADASIAAIVAGDGSVSWPPATLISGSVKSGAPAGGEFVPSGTVGLGYTQATDYQIAYGSGSGAPSGLVVSHASSPAHARVVGWRRATGPSDTQTFTKGAGSYNRLRSLTFRDVETGVIDTESGAPAAAGTSFTIPAMTVDAPGSALVGTIMIKGAVTSPAAAPLTMDYSLMPAGTVQLGASNNSNQTNIYFWCPDLSSFPGGTISWTGSFGFVWTAHIVR